MTVKLLTKQHLEFLSLKESCKGSSESTLVKMLLCWKSHDAAQMHIKNDLKRKTVEHNKLYNSTTSNTLHLISYKANLVKRLKILYF